MFFVTGAPGAGKSAVAQVLLDLDGVLVFDADWLLQSASQLVGRSMAEASDLWPDYGRMWIAILDMVVQNHSTVVFLSPIEPRSLPALPWPEYVSWCLLDCDDETRTARLKDRGWSASAITEALADARTLRSQVSFIVDTSNTDPREAADRVAIWVRAKTNHNSQTA